MFGRHPSQADLMRIVAMKSTAEAVRAARRMGKDPIDQAFCIIEISGILGRFMQREHRQGGPCDVTGRCAILRRVFCPDLGVIVPPAG